jgi:CDP-diacylglycerol--serine O-phosphatidyltransferase
VIRRRGIGPRHRRWQELRERRRRSIFLLPSLLTTGNLFCGFLAVVWTAEGRYDHAALAILAGIVLDVLDGRIARLMQATSQFGVEFDSLADVVSFCVAPAFLLYAVALSRLGRAAWLGAFLFVICGALRLARFNVHTGTIDRRFFIGLPTPAAAGLASATVLLFGGAELPRWGLFAISAATYLVALLMVSTVRYWSFKELAFAQRHPLETLLVVVLGIMIIATHHQLFLFVLFAVYVLSGPVRYVLVGRREAPALAAEPEGKGVIDHD